MNTSTKLIGLGAACVACCTLPAVGIALAGTAFASFASAYVGWVAAAGMLGVASFLLLRTRPVMASGASCGCGSACQTNAARNDDEPPIACSLPSGAYSERVAWIRDLATDALISARRDDLTLQLTYASHAAPRVHEMVEKEKACCAFLSFALAEDAERVHLTITAPEKVREAADVLFNHFVPEPPSVRD